MKKLLCIAAFAGMFGFGYCQDVRVNINNQEATTKEDCAFRINGICSSEDIGGVDVSFEFIEDCTWAVFTNYNSFPVTVLYKIRNSGEHRGCNCPQDCYSTPHGSTGTIVLGVEGSKKVKLDQNHSCYGYYYDNTDAYGVDGIISRKLSN